MSLRLMNAVFDADLSKVQYSIPAHVAQTIKGRPEKVVPEETGTLSSGDKFVLFALADNADDGGGSIYPSVELLTKKTEMSERGCRDALRHLQGAKLLDLEHAEHTLWVPKRGRMDLRNTRTYQINIDLLATFQRPKKENLEGALGAGSEVGTGHWVPGGGGTECRVDGALGAPESSVGTISRNHQKKQKQPLAPRNGAAKPAQSAVQLSGLLPGVAVVVDAAVVLEAPPVPRPRPTVGTHAAAAPGASAATAVPAPRSPAVAPPSRRGHPGIALFVDRWMAHYGKAPTINPKRIGILTRIYDGFGPEAPEEYPRLLDAFFRSTDRFIVVDNAHSPEVLQVRLDSLRVNGAGSTLSKLGPHGEATARAGLAWMQKKLAADGASR